MDAPSQPPDERPSVFSILPTGDVLFFFSGQAPRCGLVRCAWPAALVLPRTGVYARAGSGFYRTSFRVLGELHPRLDAGHFVRVHQSVVVNWERVTAVYLEGRGQYLGVLAGSQREWVAISRRFFPFVRRRLGWLQRHQRRGGPPSSAG